MSVPPESHLRLVSGAVGTAASPETQLLPAFIQQVEAAIYATDAEGRIVFYNEAAAALWGCRPELGKSQFCGSWKLFWPDGRALPHDQCPMAMALQQKRPIRNMEAVAERPDGSRVSFVPYPTPIFAEDGTLTGAVNMLIDTSSYKVAEAGLNRLAAIVESSDEAIIAKDLDGIITDWNRGAEQLFGYSAAEVIGKPVTILIPPGRMNEEPEILSRIRRGEQIDHYETIRRRKDGSLVEISLTVSPVRDASGAVLGASKIARDITERRRAEAKNELLIGEMKHRIRNTLSSVQALAAQTLRSASREELSDFSARLRALGAAYDVLTKDWDRALLADIVKNCLKPFERVDRFAVNVAESIYVSPDQALGLSLVLHELATNALKYGALSNDTGTISLTTRLEGRTLTLKWQELGGPPVKYPSRRGFGSRLIGSVFDRSTSDIAFHPEGVICTLTMRV